MSDIIKQNPLMDYCRREMVFLTLPSQKNNKEVGIKPMTARDELLFKTPDALLNGEAIIKVITSCCDSIENPYKLPINDIDALLLAIKLASYGEEMEISLICEKCEFNNTFKAPIQTCLDNIEFLDDEYSVTLSELSQNLTLMLKPYTFKQGIDESLKQFNETKALSYLITNENDMSTEDQKKYNESIIRIANYNISLLADCILSIINKDGNKLDVTHDNITSWVSELPLSDANIIIEEIKRINTIGVKKDIHVICQNKECGHKWDAELNFDPSYFFGKGS